MRRAARARLMVLALALIAGTAAAFLAAQTEDPKIVHVAPAAPRLETIDILVATRDLDTGNRVQSGDFRWDAWPASAASPKFITRTSNPAALEQYRNALIRTAIIGGEPISDAKLIRADGSGYMALLVSEGMRAIATEISPESGVGGFVLPNDRVDVLLTQAKKSATGDEYYTSETILSDIKILAIDQKVNEANGQKVVVGKIAILELSPRQSETLALARRLGSVSLALRNFADRKNDKSFGLSRDDGSDTINVVRFGVNVPKTTK